MIAAGALSPAMAGTFIKAGLPDLLYPSELIGIIIIYIGYVLAVSSRPAANEARPASAQ